MGDSNAIYLIVLNRDVNGNFISYTKGISEILNQYNEIYSGYKFNFKEKEKFLVEPDRLPEDRTE